MSRLAGIHPAGAGIRAAQLRRQAVTEQNVRALANWKPTAPRTEEIPFVVARIVLQDFTGVPLLVDLAAMRSAVARLGKNPKMIEPLVPVDLVVDHSVQVDFYGTPRRPAPEPGDGIPAQPRALPVPEMGDAGVRDLQSRAAGHRHRPPGEPGISGQGRAVVSATVNSKLRLSIIPTRWWAPIRTRR